MKLGAVRTAAAAIGLVMGTSDVGAAEREDADAAGATVEWEDADAAGAAVDGGSPARPGGSIAAAVAGLLARSAYRPGVDAATAAALASFYAGRGYAPAWVDDTGLRVGAETLVATFLRAGDDGLDPEAYGPSQVRSDPPTSPHDLARAEIALSAALVRYASDLRTGRLVPARTDAEGRIVRKSVDGAAVLAGAAATADLGGYLRSLVPTNPLYLGLRRSLAEYRRAAARGGWEAPGPDHLELGNVGEPVSRLRASLQAPGDLLGAPAGIDAEIFDEDLVLAVQSFQTRHGLPADGVVGAETRDVLAIDVQARLRQILVNLERVRWLPDDLGERHILVNLAGFTLTYVEQGAEPMTMRAIVGKPARSSPEFSGLMTYLEVNPTWSVPRIIAIEDLLPKIRKDPQFLATNRFTLRTADGTPVDPQGLDWATVRASGFPYWLRQRPGPANALGRIKFMLHNSFDVYLHDTPARGLFARPMRAYSSGCIRLEKPLDLAVRLLAANGEWSAERLKRVIAGGQTRAISLRQPVPVHLVYLTSWRDPDGTVQFRSDIYGRDRPLEMALSTPAKAPIPAGATTTAALP